MARRRKRKDVAISPADQRSGEVKSADIVANVKQLIAAKIAEKYAEDPEKFARLVEVGLVDEATLRTLPEGTNFDTASRQFRDRLAAMASDEPSVLERLQVRPLEVLPHGEPAGQTLPEVNRAVVFSDLEGFTEYTSEKGDREASATLRDHYDTVDSIVRGRGGIVGNDTLDEETARIYELTGRWQHRGLIASLGAFYVDVDSFIEKVPLTNDVDTFVNRKDEQTLPTGRIATTRPSLA